MWSEDRIEALIAGLEAVHGVPDPMEPTPCLDMLIACILSQHTSDTNSHRAWLNLREAFPDWADLLDAPTAAVEEAIRPGGLARSKARFILGVVRHLVDQRGAPDLEYLYGMTDDEARRELMRLPGVGPKTAAIVLCFAMGRAALPVDTHVHRVSRRLGMIPDTMGEGPAHEALGRLVPSQLVYRFHMALIRHGRTICKARQPRCDICPVVSMCAYAADRARANG